MDIPHRPSPFGCLGRGKQSVEDRRLDHRIIEAIPAGLVDRHACVEEKMEPTGRTNVYDLKASAEEQIATNIEGTKHAVALANEAGKLQLSVQLRNASAWTWVPA